MPASVQTLRSSAPVVFGQSRARSSKRMSRSAAIVLAWILRICVLPSRSGKPNSTLRSNRPGRNKAGSKVSGLLVAINTLILPRGSNPSSSVTICSIVRCTSLSDPPSPSPDVREPPMASTSSKKIMHAFFDRAMVNNSRTILAPSPTYFWTNSEPITRMKHASVLLATALADKVLPVPGGPYNNTPFGGSIPKVKNLSGCNNGSSTTSRNFSRESFAPPTSSYVTSGLSSTVINETVGSILGGKGIWIAYFVRSTPTLIPSSTSVGATFSPNPTTNFAICLTLMTYLQSSPVPDSSIIFVHLATCKGCSSWIACLSATPC